jgi:hypothetical protein
MDLHPKSDKGLQITNLNEYTYGFTSKIRQGFTNYEFKRMYEIRIINLTHKIPVAYTNIRNLYIRLNS